MTSVTFITLLALISTIQCMEDMMPIDMDGDGPAFGPEKVGHGRMGRRMESGSWEGRDRGFRRGMNPFEGHGRWHSSEMRRGGGQRLRHHGSRGRFEPFVEERRWRHRPPGPWYYRPRGQMDSRRGPWRHGFRGRAGYQRPNQCPKWQKWEESSCLWPGTKIDLPKSCQFMNMTKRLPEAVSKYYEAKGKEVAEVIHHVFKERGLTKPCGFCSRKIACRKGKSRGIPHRSIAFAFVNEECEGGDACRISLVDGGCPAPFPQEKFLKYNQFVLKKSRQNDYGFHGPFEFNGHRFGFEPHQQHQRMMGWNRPQWDDPSGDDDDLDAGDQSSSANGDERITTSSVESSSSNEASPENPLPKSSIEKASASAESNEHNSNEISKSNETTEKPPSSSSKESSSSSQEEHGHGRGRGHRRRPGNGLGKRYTPYIPLWHCVKSEKLNTCLCCCGGYFPDIENGKCILIKHGNFYPPFDMFSRSNI